MKTKTIITATAAALLSAASFGAMANSYDADRDIALMESRAKDLVSSICEKDLDAFNEASSIVEIYEFPHQYNGSSEYCKDSGGVDRVRVTIAEYQKDTYNMVGIAVINADIFFNNGDQVEAGMSISWRDDEMIVGAGDPW